MKVIRYEFEIEGRNGDFQLDVYGDTHLGSKSVDEKLLRKHVKETAETGRYWCHVGDVIDGIVPPDRRFDKRNLADWAWAEYQHENLIQAEWDEFYNIFNPIADKCLFVLDGDGKHNETKDVSDCMGQTLSKMNVRGGYPACHVECVFTRKESPHAKHLIEGVFHHGWFSGRRKGGKANNLELALLTYPTATFFICGHGHDKMPVRSDALVLERHQQKQWVRRAAMTGAYLQTYASDTVGYGERHGYSPASLGRMTVVLRPFIGYEGSTFDAEKRIEFFNM